MPVDRNSEVLHNHSDKCFNKTLGFSVCFGLLIFGLVKRDAQKQYMTEHIGEILGCSHSFLPSLVFTLGELCEFVSLLSSERVKMLKCSGKLSMKSLTSGIIAVTTSKLYFMQ